MTPAARDGEDAELDLELTMATRGLFGALFDEFETDTGPDGRPSRQPAPAHAEPTDRETRDR